MDRRPALGKGLSALIPESPPEASGGITELDIDLIAPNEDQPRLQMDDDKLEDLAKSIRANGIIQPLLVQHTDDGYQIIAGERRWRAAQRAGLLKVPVVMREIKGEIRQQQLQLALIENIQREDLNCVDEALAYQRLADEFHLTQDQIAAGVGKDRSSISNYLRLLKLPEDIRENLGAGVLSMGHARALLALADPKAQRQAAREVIARGLSVRDAEALVKRLGSPPVPTATGVSKAETDIHTRAAEERMRFTLGTNVRILRKGSGGSIEIQFTSETELNRLYGLLTDRAQ
tara:strand:+ start:3032 stop:3901 length:870 start_codon:yes stop_codon:yes gene_type:complete